MARTPSQLGMQILTHRVLVYAPPFTMRSAKAVEERLVKSVIGYSFLKKKRILSGSVYAQKALRRAFNDKPKKISPLKDLFLGLFLDLFFNYSGLT